MFAFIKEEKQEYHLSLNDIIEIEQKYDVSIPDILKQYYLKHNGDSIQLCEFYLDDYGFEVAKIIPLKYTDFSCEDILYNDRIDGIIDSNMFPIARNEGGDYYYWDKTTEKVYMYFCDDIENPFYICQGIDVFFDMMSDNN